MKILYSSMFNREYKKLSEKIKRLAEENEKVFRDDPFDKKLKTHKLSGKFKSFWSFSVGYRYRIVFEFAKRDTVYFHSIGTHDIYQ